VSLVSANVSYFVHENSTDLSQSVRLNFGLILYLDRNFHLRLSLSISLRHFNSAIVSVKSLHFFDLSLG